MTDLERRLRRIVLVVALLGIASALAGLLPGEQVYRDTNHCSGITDFLGLSDCHEHIELVETRSAGGPALLLLVGAILAYGAVLRSFPSRAAALGWGVWTLLCLLGFASAMFKLEFGAHVVTLWAVPLTYTLLGAMLLLIFPIAPIVAFASKRASPAEDVASARVVSR